MAHPIPEVLQAFARGELVVVTDDLRDRGVRADTLIKDIAAAFEKVLELGIPFVELGCVGDDRLEFFISVHPEGSLGERWPMYGNFTAELPGPDFAQKMWEV